jgi:dipeptidyl aminopeptidase/acylaminoacyl peptidase
VDADYVVLRVARRGHFGSEGNVSAYQDEPSGLSVDQFERLLYEEATDVMAAFAFLSECPFVDPRRVAIGGHSTGGFITVVAAARLPNVAAVANINGGISWSQGGVQHGWPATKAMFVREAPKIRAPVFVLLGSRDDQLPPDIGLTLAEALRRQGGPVEVRVYVGGHVDWPVDELVKFLNKHLKPSRQ